MGLVGDLLVRRWRRYGEQTDLPDRKVTEVRELTIEDTGAASRLTGLKRPTASQTVGALAVAADTNADDDADDLGYSSVLTAHTGIGLEFSAVADPAALTGTGVRVRSKTTTIDGSVLMADTADGDARVLTSPRLVGGVKLTEVGGSCSTTDDTSWVTLVSIPVRGVVTSTMFEVSIIVTSGVANSSIKLWGTRDSDGSISTTYLLLGATTLSATNANVQVVDPGSGSALNVQVKGIAVANHTWIGYATIVGDTV